MSCQAILVNFQTGRLLKEAVVSLADDPACTEIAVVDNSVCPREEAWLRKNLPDRTRLMVAEENLGFGLACNRAFAESNSEFVLLLNPDARLLPGALSRLMTTMRERPHAGAVGPRIYWDTEKRFLLPPSTYPSRLGFFLDRLAECLPVVVRWQASSFASRSLRGWRARLPYAVAALSGGHVLLRRAAIVQAGGLFDQRFFMYWEDSDLMRRLHDARWSLLVDPRAEAIHLYEHSVAKDCLIATGWRLFAEKYFSAAGWRALAALTARCRTSVAKPEWAVTTLMWNGDSGIEIDVPVDWQRGWLLEVSPSQWFVPSMGCLGDGAVASIPAELLRRFAGCSTYLRLRATHRRRGVAPQVFSVTAAAERPAG